MSSQELYDLLIVAAHSADRAFATSLYEKLAKHKSWNVFYDRKCICWGDVKYSSLTKAFQRSKRVLIIVSEGVLRHPAMETETLLGSVFESDAQILPVYLDVTEAMVKEKHCFLTSYQSLSMSASRASVDSLVAKLIQHFEKETDSKVRQPPRSLLQFHPTPLLSINRVKGREEELSSLMADLSSVSMSRVVHSITGPPGFGKRALVIELGHRLKNADSTQSEPERNFNCKADNSEYDIVHRRPPGKSECTVIYADVSKCYTQKDYASVILDAMNVIPNKGEEFQQLCNIVRLPINGVPVLILDRCDVAIRSRLSQFLDLLRIVTPVFQVVTTSWSHFDSLHFRVKRRELRPLSVEATCDILMELCPKEKCLTKEQAELFAELCGCMPIALQIIGAGLRNVYWPEEFLERLAVSASSVDTDMLEELDSLTATSGAYQEKGVTVCIQAVFDSLSKNLQQQTLCLTLFNGPFKKDEAALVLGITQASFPTDVMAPLKQRSLLIDGEKGIFIIHRLILDFLKSKCRRENPPLFAKAQERFARHFCGRFREIAHLFFKDPVKACCSFQEIEFNFDQLKELTGLEETAEFIDFALGSSHLLKSVMSPMTRASFFEACCALAAEKHCWAEFVRFKINQLNAVLDNLKCDLVKAWELLDELKNKADCVSDRRLYNECWIAEAQLLLHSNQHDDAFTLMRKMFEKYKDEVSAVPLVAVNAYITYANTWEERGDFISALVLYQKAINIYAELFGDESPGYGPPKHPIACAIELQIARCQFNMGSYGESRRIYDEVLKTQKVLSCDPLSQAATLYQRSIAEACDAAASKSKGFPSIPDSVLEDFCRVQEEVSRLCDDHPLIILTPLALGKIHFWKGIDIPKGELQCFERAAGYFEKALKECRKLSKAPVADDILTPECIAYRIVANILSTKRARKVDNEIASLMQECRHLTLQLATGKVRDGFTLPPVVQLVSENDFEDTCLKVKYLRRTLQKFTEIGTPCRFADCFNALESQGYKREKLDIFSVPLPERANRSQQEERRRKTEGSQKRKPPLRGIRQSLSSSLVTSFLHLKKSSYPPKSEP